VLTQSEAMFSPRSAAKATLEAKIVKKTIDSNFFIYSPNSKLNRFVVLFSNNNAQAVPK